MSRLINTLNQIAKEYLAFPKVGSLHDCTACFEPKVAKFLGVKAGKGQWEWVREHICVRGIVVPATRR